MVKPNFAKFRRHALISTPKLFGLLSQDCSTNTGCENEAIVALDVPPVTIHGELPLPQVHAKGNGTQIGYFSSIAITDCDLKP